VLFRSVAAQELELSRAEVAAARAHLLAKPFDQAGLTHAGVTRHDRQHFLAARNAFERLRQLCKLAFAPVEAFRDRKVGRCIVLAELEHLDPTGLRELHLAAHEIGEQAARAPVPIVFLLAEQPEQDLGNRVGHVAAELTRRRRGGRDVVVHRFERVAPAKWHAAGQELEQRHTERIEIAPLVPGIASPSVLGGCVRWARRRARWRDRLSQHANRGAEIAEAHHAGRRIQEHVGRIDVEMDERSVVKALHRFGDGDGELHELRHRNLRCAPAAFQRDAAEVLENEREARTGGQELEVPDDVRAGRPLERAPAELEFVAQPAQIE